MPEKESKALCGYAQSSDSLNRVYGPVFGGSVLTLLGSDALGTHIYYGAAHFLG